MANKKPEYSIITGLLKSLKNTAIVAIPIVATTIIMAIPAGVKEMTVGAVLTAIVNFAVNWLKNK